MEKIITNIKKLYSPDSGKNFASVKVLDSPEILIENDKIAEIRLQSDQKFNRNGAEVIDAQNCCVLPGFVDAHTHPVFLDSREKEFIMRIEGSSYEEIAAAGGGIRNSARSFRNAAAREIKDVTARRIARFLEYGTTTIEAKSGYGLSTEDELKSLRIIAELNNEQPLEMIPTFLGAHEVPDEYRDKRNEYINLIINEMIPSVAGENLAQYCDVFCEKGVFSTDETELIINKAAQFGLKARLHVDELHSVGGAELAAKLGAVTADHLVKISDEGIKAMAHKNVTAILLPATTFFLRKDEYAPARKLLDHGCSVAIATDFNPGSCMTQNMQMLWTIATLKMGMLPEELLWSTTLIPARTLDLESTIGSIDSGKQADLVLLDIPNLEYLPYHFAVNHVKLTIKKGKVVFGQN